MQARDSKRGLPQEVVVWLSFLLMALVALLITLSLMLLSRCRRAGERSPLNHIEAPVPSGAGAGAGGAGVGPEHGPAMQEDKP